MHFLTKTILIILLFSFLPMTFPNTVSAATLTRPPNNLGLVGYWPMDEGVGTQVGDMSGNGNNGTLSGATLPTWADGKRGKAISFDDDDDYVSAANFINGSAANSFSFWVYYKSTQFGSYSNLMGQGTSVSNRYLMFTYQNKVAFTASSAFGVSSNTALNMDSWNYVTVVVDDSGTNATFYLNGNYNGGGSFPNVYNNQGSFYLSPSNSIGIGGYTLNGLIDDVRIYNRALTASEVSSLYSSGQITRRTPSNNGLVGYWSFNEGRGGQAGDSSGNGNTGTITGASWVNGKRGKALSFNGSSDYVDAGDKSNLNFGTGDFSISLWYKSGQLNTDRRGLIVKASSYNTKGYSIQYFASTDELYFYLNDGTNSQSLKVVPAGGEIWRHAVFVVDRSVNKAKAYYNGNFEGEVSISLIGDLSTTEKFVIGAFSLPTRYFNGSIDDVRIYNRALSAAEISALANTGQVVHNAGQNNRLTNGLVGLWSFNGYDIDNSSTTAEILDRSGNGNNGDNVGATPTQGKVGQALKFNGTSDYVISSNMVSNFSDETVTIGVWFKANAAGVIVAELGQSAISTSWHDSQIEILSTGEVKVRVWQLPSVSLGTVNFGEWHYAVLRYNKATLNLDGFLDGIEAATNVSGDRSAPWEYGSGLYYAFGPADTTNLGSGAYFNGSIDEVRIYNRALSASEVKQLYNMGK